MSDFVFFGTWDDSWQVLAAILEYPGYSIIPDSRYTDSVPFRTSTVNTELKKMCRERGAAFIWSTAFSLLPPVLVRIEEGKNAGKYFLDLSRGGPGLGLHLPGCYEQNGKTQLAPGSLWYPKKTFDVQSREWTPASASLRLGYREVRANIKNQLVPLQVETTRILIGEVAKGLVENGQACLHGVGS